MEINAADAAAPEVDVVEHQDVDEPVAAEATPEAGKTIAEEWADEYDAGAELFCATFDADDFDPEYGTEYPDGTTVAVRRCLRKPPPGWIRQHAHLSDLERTFALIEKHCSDKALDILDSLSEKPWNGFVEAWGRDGGLIEGKISQVCAAVRQVEDAIRRDMVLAGRTFDDGSLDWDDLYAFIFASPPGTAVFHAFEKGWTTSDYLLAHVIDALRINNWQRTEGAHKNPPQGAPDPFPRPGDDEPKRAEGTVSAGTTAATRTTVGKFMAMRAEREKRWREKHQRGEGA
ncbi:tail assembly chaperone [Mycobacterium phage Findley]|uniref:Tail assembly chaperone n=1 Tax=Mycobacterium phage Findley TaxID=2015882 RepID=A0A222ZPU3_9CAUD|nr:tail assembly chaperone [Mycobacterium phage Milly]YP_009951101.1 tail assembly chaperone [Mycobacterium phage Findley]AJA43689.1 tail assembly chaperone [Mycobacterium phage Milly]ASR86756.1 tail assembly chaperone [Mycobacterium phage Findley]